jgi:hypothetical protein
MPNASICGPDRSPAGRAIVLLGWWIMADTDVVTERPAQSRPVPSAEAGRNLGLLVIAFGVTVVVTRLFLVLSGYPQVGGGTYHIAHALWGGLLLMIGSMLPLLWANRWILTLSALCGGVGVGLFIDEVGKYITTKNDYFFPLAAPIIYLAFLVILVVARRASRPRGFDARGQTYRVLDDLTRVADGAMSATTQRALDDRLAELERSTDRPDLAGLATSLRPYVASLVPTSKPAQHPHLTRVIRIAGRVEYRLLPRFVHRLLLIIGSLVVGLFSMVGLVVILALASNDPENKVIIDDKTVPPGTHPPALLIAAGGETIVGLLLLTGAVLLTFGRDRIGIAALRAGVIFGLAAVNVVLGYVSAELVLTVVLFELVGLALSLRYRTRFLTTPPPAMTT